MLNKINRKRFYAIFIPAVIIISLVFICLYNINYFKKHYSNYYYDKAEEALYEFNNDQSTEYVIKAIKADPGLNSQKYLDFKDKRKKFLEDEANKNKYFNQ